MTPAEHYEEAERLLRLINEDAEEQESMGWVQARMTRALVHATLATVPASALPIERPKPGPRP